MLGFMPAKPWMVRTAAEALRAGRVTSVQLTEGALRQADLLDESLGTFITRFSETALERAERADEELAAGIDHGPYHGIPVGIKDNIAAAEGPTTAQSLVLDPAWAAGKDAPVTRRLRASGAVLIGKTTLLEFAMGLPDMSKPFPIPRNPWDLTRWAGGSSSGSGSGVASGMMLAGVGTDTGASIRMPAAFCGVTGLKPTYSLVPKSGCVPLGYSLDVIGPLARSAWDCGAMLQAIAGYHPSDPYSSTRPVLDCLSWLGGDLTGLRVGVARTNTLQEGTDPRLLAVFDAALSTLAELGADIFDVSLPLWHEVGAAMMVTTISEGAAYHHDDLAARWSDFFHKTRTTMSWGTFVSGADYVQAQRVRRAAQDAVRTVFSRADVVVTPTCSTTPPRVDDLESVADDVLAMLHTPYWSALGSPALSVPIGYVDGLPIGMQVATQAFGEAELIRVGDAYQQRTDWHLRIPPLAADRMMVVPSYEGP